MDNKIEVPEFNAIIIDDHVLFAQGFSELLKTMAPGCEIRLHSSVEKAKNDLKTGKYHYLFVDLLMPGVNTKEFVSSCRKEYPELIIIIISTIQEISKVREFFGIGINGYLSKAVSYFELKLALEKTYNGDKYVSSDINSRMTNSLFSAAQTDLTEKELEVLRLIAEGWKVNKIAESLFLSPFTIMAHRRNIMKKLDLHSAAELVKYAYEHKLN
ncbi:MAG: response regulator transcription factor [Bacteroidetes bacterium]|nr:response regulator transcription factor [Bacteroidota bacterium]